MNQEREPDATSDGDNLEAGLLAAGTRLRLAAGSAPAIDPAADLARRGDRRRRRSRRAVASAAASVLLVGGAVLAAAASGGPPTADSVRSLGRPESSSTTTSAVEAEQSLTPTAPPDSTSTTMTSAELIGPTTTSTTAAGPPVTTTVPLSSGLGTAAPSPATIPPTSTTVPARPKIVMTVIHDGKPFAGATAYIPGFEKTTGSDGRAVFEVPPHWGLPDTYEVGAGWKDPEPYRNPSSPFDGCTQWWNSYERIPVTQDGATVTIVLDGVAWGDCPGDV